MSSAAGFYAGSIVMTHAKHMSLASSVRPVGPYVPASENDLYWAPLIDDLHRVEVEQRYVLPWNTVATALQRMRLQYLQAFLKPGAEFRHSLRY